MEILANTVVATYVQRRRAGLDARPPGIVGPSGFDWPDTPLGVVRDEDRYRFFGSDGSCHAHCAWQTERDGTITTTTGPLDDPLGNAPPLETILPQSSQFRPYAVVYVGGGPVAHVPAGHSGAGNLLMVSGAARHGNPLKRSGNDGFIGLAKSLDDGVRRSRSTTRAHGTSWA